MTTATGDTLNYTYDALKRLNNVTTKNASGTALFSTSYAFRNLSTTSGITQTTTQVQYRNVCIGTNGTILEGKKYSYDDVGNITKISQSTSPYNPLVAYEYDSQNQLTKETYYDGAGSETDNITKTITYTYDTAGNILSETKTVGTTTTTKNYTYGNTQWRDLLTKVGNTTISYDGGNPTNWYNGSKTYTGLTWQQGRQLAGLTVGETSVSYEYDADGIRTKMVAGDVTYEFVTQGGKLMRETATNSSAVYVMDFIYDNAGRPFAVKFSKNGGSSFTTFYYVLNLQGDVVAITKADGTVVAKYTYDAWGNLTSLINANGTEIVNRTTGTAIAFWNPLTYRGYIRDRETGFYYLQSRYYDPANHRFINADSYASTGQGCIGTNMFAYCLNNPVTATDPTGYDSTTDSNGNGIADYLEIRWFVQTEKAKIQLASKNGALRDVTEEVDKALKYACFIGDAYRALIESGGPIFRAEKSVYALKKFYTMVNHEAEWDIKRKAQWESTIGTTFPGYDTVVLYHNQAMTPEMIGNYTYGVIGEAFGFSIDTLLAGSFVAAGFPTEGAELINEYTDWNYIRRGYYHISLDGAY